MNAPRLRTVEYRPLVPMTRSARNSRGPSGPSAEHPFARPDQIPNLRPHVQLEGRVLAGLFGEHGEDRRLGDKAADEAQRFGRDPGPPPSPLVEVYRLDDGPGELAEPISESHLVEGVNAAGLQPVAAEGTLKVGVPLEQCDLHPAAGQQVGESRSRGACTDDDDSSDRHDGPSCCLEYLAVLGRTSY